MNSLNATITEFLNSLDTEWLVEFMSSNFTQDECEWDSEESLELKTVFWDNKITVQWKDSYGGEGMGDDYWSVYRFSKDLEEVFVKFQGYYSSYNGADYTDWYFVKPEAVTVIQFNRI